MNLYTCLNSALMIISLGFAFYFSIAYIDDSKNKSTIYGLYLAYLSVIVSLLICVTN